MSIVFRHPAHWYWCSLREGFHLRWNTLIAIIVLLYYEECRCFKECCCNSINYNTSSNTRSKIWIWDLFRQKNPLNFVSKGVQQKALLQEVNQNLSNNYGFLVWWVSKWMGVILFPQNTNALRRISAPAERNI